MNKQSLFNSLLFLIAILFLVLFILYVKYNPSLKAARVGMDVSVLPSSEFVYISVRLTNTGSGQLRNGLLVVHPPQGFETVIDNEDGGHLDKYPVELKVDETKNYEFKLKHVIGVGKFVGSVMLTTPDKTVSERREFILTISEQS